MYECFNVWLQFSYVGAHARPSTSFFDIVMKAHCSPPYVTKQQGHPGMWDPRCGLYLTVSTCVSHLDTCASSTWVHTCESI